MKSFSGLLSEYVERAGIPDADLARRMGVSRQTVFRWREGTTRAPRRREDLLTLARLLRLDSGERDDLLLSAGFAPEPEAFSRSTPSTEFASGREPAEAGSLPGAGLPQARPSLSAPRSLMARLTHMIPWRVVGVLLVGILAFGAVALAIQWGIHAWSDALEGRRPEPARTGETLVLISEFANYSGAQAGFNVAGRLRESLRDAFASAGLADVRIEVWPQTIKDPDAASQLAEDSGATIVIWGEYDSGRVVARVSAYPSDLPIQGGEQRWLLNAPSQLNATINSDLPADVQWMALLVIGQVDYWIDRPAQAESAFHQALASPSDDPAGVATAYSYMAALESKEAAPDWDQVLAYLTEALQRQPAMTLALNNRGVAYLQRGAPGDLQRAEADFRDAMSVEPTFSSAPFNLALALLREPTDKTEEALQLLKLAASLNPLSPGALNALCWTLSLEGRPEEALPYCDEAVKLDETGNSHDSRGLALALLRRFEDAAADFTRFMELASENDPQVYAQRSQTRQEWIDALQRGENPFNAQTLGQLREEER